MQALFFFDYLERQKKLLVALRTFSITIVYDTLQSGGCQKWLGYVGSLVTFWSSGMNLSRFLFRAEFLLVLPLQLPLLSN